MTQADRTLDTRGMKCPIPVLRATKEIKKMESGEVIEIWATDGQAPRDFKDYCAETGHELLPSEDTDDHYVIIIKKS